MKRKGYQRYDQIPGLAPWERKVYDDLRNVAGLERLEPTSGASWWRHLWAAVSVAFCLGLAVTGISIAVQTYAYRIQFDVAFKPASFWGAMVGFSSLIILALMGFADFRDGLASVERVLNRDLDGDGKIGGPSTRIEITIQGRGERILDVPVPDYVLRSFAVAAVNGQPISEREWTGEDKMTPTQYRTWRDLLIERGFAKWINSLVHRLGWVLTEDGLDAMQELAEG